MAFRALLLTSTLLLLSPAAQAGLLRFTISGAIDTATVSGAGVLPAGTPFQFSFVIPDMTPTAVLSTAAFSTVINAQLGSFGGQSSGVVVFPAIPGDYSLAGMGGLPGGTLDFVFASPALYSGPLTAPDFSPGTYSLTNPVLTLPWAISYQGSQYLVDSPATLIIEEVPEPATVGLGLAAAAIVMLRRPGSRRVRPVDE